MYVLDYLRSRGVWFEPLLHHPASCSTKRAGCMHVPGRGVAKAVLIKAADSFVLAVLPSTSWIDLRRLSDAMRAPVSTIRLATLDEVVGIFADCEPGVVPAFGRLYGLVTLVDSGLATQTDIVLGANTRHEGLRMRFEDFQTLEQPTRATFGRPIAHGDELTVPSCRDGKRRAV
jgi:Ala-tRNA(Pro) deacylase